MAPEEASMRRPAVPRSSLAGLAAAVLLCACGGGENAPEAGTAADSLVDTLTTAEQEAFAVDPLRYPEMRGGRLDTVNMIAETEYAAWHAQAMNYSPDHIAMTYAAWYTGPDSVALLATDGQPHLVDDLGNVYRGVMVPSNPRFKIASGTTAVGVYVFLPGIAADADSLTLFVNDSTAPVFRVGPFGVRHDATGPLSPGGRRGIEIQTDD
jgi:hypothetical protein